MKSFVDKELCIGCGNCENICSDAFEMKDDDKSQLKMNFIPAEHK
jgi:ferredoxin